MQNAGIAQLVERNLAKVEVESSRLFSAPNSKGSSRLPFFLVQRNHPIFSDCVALVRWDVALRRRPGYAAGQHALGGWRPDGEIGRHCGLKIRRFLKRGVPVRPRLGAPLRFNHVKLQRPFEIHVHGQVQLRADASFEQLQDALKPLWKYAGARSLADGATSAYEEEPGIKFDPKEHLLQICWTVRAMKIFARHSTKCA